MKLDNNENTDAVAIIGMSGRFPGASNIEEFWKNLCDGRESITFFTDNDLDPFVDLNDVGRSNYIKARGILKDVDKFDAALFSITPLEAAMMDPQQRIFMELSWEALETAGYNPDVYDGLIGVYAGMSENTYYENHVLPRRDLIETFGAYQTGLVNQPHFMATRISYKLNLKGPSINVFTGCSTSLAAVCHGVDSLISYQSDIVIAGGISIWCPQNQGYLYQEGGIPSGDGHCRAFDARAQGTVASNGGGAVVLKRLDEAITDGDHIYCVIRGTGMNNNGSSPVSFTAPSVSGQAQVVAMAQAAAGIDPGTISYIEAHGTGTALGDPIEIAGLKEAFRLETDKNGFCAIGSVKTNIGHLDAAAGIAGLIKTSLALKYAMIPPTINFEKPNPKLDIENSPFYVNASLSRWAPKGLPRRAGVSSLGVGGTNTHVVLEQAPEVLRPDKSRPWQLLVLSGRTDSALDMVTRNLSRHLKRHPEPNLADVAYTLMRGRKSLTCRRIAVFQNNHDAAAGLEKLSPHKIVTSSQLPVKRDVVFMFSGQGSQYVNMGRELYHTENEFRYQVDRCSKILLQHLSFDLRDVIYPHDDTVETAEETLKQTAITQPALFVVEYALACLWMSWGIKPAAMVGHSIGEYVAACLSGVFSLEDALSLVVKRGRLIQALPGGSMIAVAISENDISPMLNGAISLALINCPSLCVVSGETDAVRDLEKKLVAEEIHFRYLHTSHAFHSAMLDPVLNEFYQEVEQIRMAPPEIPFVSNVSGKWITTEEVMAPDYWVRHMRQTVRFSDCMDVLTHKKDRLFLEVGPGQTLATFAQQHPKKMKEQVVLSSTRHPQEQASDSAFILNTLGRLWMNGAEVDWSGFYADEKRRRIPLPTYPFERKRYWIDPEISRDIKSVSGSDVVGQEGAESLSGAGGVGPEQRAPDVVIEGNDVERIVAEAWKDILGIDHVASDDNFFELGGNSLIALSLFVRIEKVFGKKLPLATLYEAPTVRQIAEILKEKTWSAPWSCLVPIQPNGHSSRPPFFLMHGHGGNVLEYYPLVKNLGEDQPVYALQARGLDGNITREPVMEEIAETYIREIRTVQPNGPYYLGGFCFGGTLALEAAHQLNTQGEDVALVVMIQSASRSYFESPPKRLFVQRLYYKVTDRVGIELNNLFSLSLKAKLFYLFGRVRRFIDLGWVRLEMLADPLLVKIFGDKRPHSMIYHLESLADAHDFAFFNFNVRPYHGDVIHFTAEKKLREWGDDPTFGFGDILKGNTRIQEVPGYRQTMLKTPNVEVLAEKLGQALEETMNTQSAGEEPDIKPQS